LENSGLYKQNPDFPHHTAKNKDFSFGQLFLNYQDKEERRSAARPSGPLNRETRAENFKKAACRAGEKIQKKQSSAIRLAANLGITPQPPD
jgi:hypothetical protein